MSMYPAGNDRDQGSGEVSCFYQGPQGSTNDITELIATVKGNRQNCGRVQELLTISVYTVKWDGGLNLSPRMMWETPMFRNCRSGN